jgi:hypothetical protein
MWILASTAIRQRCMLRLAIPGQISGGAIWLRIEGNSATMGLRVFKVRWESTPWLPQPLAPGSRHSGGPNVRVRQMTPGQVQVALRAGDAASLDRIGVRVTDRAGTDVFQVSSDRLQSHAGDEYLITLDLGYRFLGYTPPLRQEYYSQTAWFLEVIATRPVSQIQPSSDSLSQMTRKYLYTDTCDDFILLSRQDWFAMRGFPELRISPGHIGALFCYSAHHAGIREVVLKDPIRMFRMEPRLESLPRTPSEHLECGGSNEFDDLIGGMDRLKRPLILAREDWGLADEELNEKTLSFHG